MSAPRARLMSLVVALVVGAGVVTAASPADAAILGTSVTTSPGSTLDAAPAVFGPRAFDVTGLLVLAVDAVAPTTNGCEAPTNNVAGFVMLVDRGVCTFKTKALNAQNAGAIGIVIASDVGTITIMNEDNAIPTAITIPAAHIVLADGDATKAAMNAGLVKARLLRTPIPRAISLAYDRPSRVFSGAITADGGCNSLRTVSIFKKARGRDRRIGQAVADGAGVFSLARKAGRGRYYATVPADVSGPWDCAAGRSGAVRVR